MLICLNLLPVSKGSVCCLIMLLTPAGCKIVDPIVLNTSPRTVLVVLGFPKLDFAEKVQLLGLGIEFYFVTAGSRQ